MDHPGCLSSAHFTSVAPPTCPARRYGAADLRGNHPGTLIPHHSAAAAWNSTAASPLWSDCSSQAAEKPSSVPLDGTKARSLTVGAAVEQTPRFLTRGHRRLQADAGQASTVSINNKALLAWINAQISNGPERLLAVFAGGERQFLAAEVLGRGNGHTVCCSWRHLFTRALAHDSRAVLLAHNHPSGVAKPSPNDLTVTRQFERMAGLLDISLIDHLIVAGGRMHSVCKARKL